MDFTLSPDNAQSVARQLEILETLGNVEILESSRPKIVGKT